MRPKIQNNNNNNNKLTKTIEELALASSIARIGQKAILLQSCHIVRKFLN